MMPDQVQYYFQLAQQHQAALQQQQQPQAAAGQVIQQPIQLQVTGGTSAPASNVQTITIQSVSLIFLLWLLYKVGGPGFRPAVCNSK